MNGDAPSLVSLCMKTISKAAVGLDGYDDLQEVFELPSELFDGLILQISPLALEKLQASISFSDDIRDGKKRARCDEFNRAWENLFKLRWLENDSKILKLRGFRVPDYMESIEKEDGANWRQRYWESHMQECLDEASEKALLPSFGGPISEIKVSDAILDSIGFPTDMQNENLEYSKLSYHCEHFGNHSRRLRLQNVMCVPGTSEMLKSTQLLEVVFRNIKSEAHADEVCKLLSQNKDTLSSLILVHCRFSSTGFENLCTSLYHKGAPTHSIQHLSITTSRVFDSKDPSAYSNFLRFLTSGSSLQMIRFCDIGMGPRIGKLVFEALCRSSVLISIDISDDNFSGWLSRTERGSSSIGVMESINVLSLRGNNLGEDDVGDLKYALLRMPHLRQLDLSDNRLTDGGLRRLIPYFQQAINGPVSLSDLILENCDLSSSAVIHLLENIQNPKNPLHSLSLADNNLTSSVGIPLAKFLGTSRLKRLNIEGVGLGPLGFQEFELGLPEEVDLVWINISKNRGRMKAAAFLAKLFSRAPQLSEVNAGCNFLPAESLPVICEALRLSRGKVERVDLTGNVHLSALSQLSIAHDLRFKGKPILILPSSSSTAAYDDDP